ncbi:MAG: hypothetical protein C4326_13245 [Ignavibacteria bacterium]
MIIGLNLLYLLPNTVGGTETYARGLIQGLSGVASKYQFILFLNRESSDLFQSLNSRFKRIICPVSAVRRHERYLYEQLLLPKLAKQNGVSVIHSLGYTTPLRASCPTVVTIHDLNFRAFGKEMPLTRRLALEFFVGMGVRSAQKIITVSEFSKQQIMTAYRLDEQRIAVIHEAPLLDHELDKSAAAEQIKERPSPPLPRPYFVAFTSASPHKNISRLIDAYALLRAKRCIQHSFVLIGHTPSDLALSRDVYATGYVSRASMLELLRGADFLVFPSYYEGFGLPILEAMACGVPVACSRIASLPEVAGEAAIYFDPFSVEEIARAVEQLTNDRGLRSRLREEGFRNVQRFSWVETARKTLAAYGEIL